MTSELRNGYATVPASSLKPAPYNPNTMGIEQFGQLVAEVARQGRLLKPVVVRSDDAGGFIIVDGEHNWLAAKEAGLETVPVEVIDPGNDFEAMRQSFKRNLIGRMHKVKLGRMFAAMIAERKLSNRDLAAELDLSEGTVRNMLLYAKAADLCVGRDDCPDEDAIAAMGIRELRKLLAWLEGIEDQEDDKPGAAEPETRILARLKRAWDKATEDERKEFLIWTGIEEDKRAYYSLGYADSENGQPHRFTGQPPREAEPGPDPRADPVEARANTARRALAKVIEQDGVEEAIRAVKTLCFQRFGIELAIEHKGTRAKLQTIVPAEPAEPEPEPAAFGITSAELKALCKSAGVAYADVAYELTHGSAADLTKVLNGTGSFAPAFVDRIARELPKVVDGLRVVISKVTPAPALPEPVRNGYAERGARIKAARTERGLSQRKLGEMAGVNVAQTSQAENGMKKAGDRAFAKLEAALGLA